MDLYFLILFLYANINIVKDNINNSNNGKKPNPSSLVIKKYKDINEDITIRMYFINPLLFIYITSLHNTI